ncbi:ankyrin repeat domain-containing protein [Fusarium mundagurra]|uniref:Ankyrin repeat domain-containing protein n=1 Tax=Fusarium mundagurra TaxID=1567541 RepID=A0A8H6DMQ5_9HYPO|nr:ankyrin repeat domain-containing protein [Fusarium mundagurra]
MDPLGATASIIAILQLSTATTLYLLSATGATKQQRRLHEEIRGCEDMLFRLKDILENERQDPTHASRISLLEGPHSPFTRLRPLFESIKVKLAPKKGLSKAFSSLVWPFNEKDVSELIAAIQREKGLLQLALENDSRGLLKDFIQKAEENHNRLIELMQNLKHDSDQQKDQLEELSTGLASLQTTQETVTNSLDKFGDAQAADQRLRILDWITPMHFASDQEDYLDRIQPGSGKWFLESDQFNGWVGGVYQTLYCPGIPGAGKTILTSLVIDHLQTHYQPEDIRVIYAFCKFSRRDEQTPRNLLATLLRQTVQGKAQIYTKITHLYETRDSADSSLSRETIIEALGSSISSYSRVFVIVDAIDELDTSRGCRDSFLASLSTISAKLVGKMSLFITSRLIPDIAERLKGCTTLEIKASETDISNFTQAQMSRLPSFVTRRPDLQSEISETILNAAQGMFLLAELQVESLVGSASPKALRTALKQLPTGYDQAYRDIMRRIDHEKTQAQRDLAYQALEWLTRAKRALTLCELRHALAVEPDSIESYLDEDNLPEEDQLVSACAGLVIVDKASGIIRLVHYTAQDFFDKTQVQAFPEDERHITSTCLKYISFDGLNGPCNSDDEYESRLRSNPFYSYAARNWGHHARNSDMSQILGSILKLVGNPNKVEAISQALFTGSRDVTCETRYSGYSQLFPRQMHGLHLAAYFGLTELVQHLVVSQDANLCDGGGMSVMSWAASRGHSEVVRILVEHSTANTAINKDDHYGCTPLILAARNGHKTTVEYLLEKGASTHATDRHGRTPLSWAAGEGHSHVVGALLEWHLGVGVNVVDEKGRSLLLLGAQRGFATVVRLLLDVGAAADKADKLLRTPLSWAVKFSDVVELLVQAKADMNASDIYQRSPLSYAAAGTYETTVRLLLEHGADVHIRDVNGWTPLRWATIKGTDKIVSLLREYGCREDIDDYQERTSTEHIVGTIGESEILDPRYHVASSHMFEPGEVFKIMYPEPSGTGAYNCATTVSNQKFDSQYGQTVIHVRRFIVITNDADYCTCLPISTYGKRAGKRNKETAKYHGIVHEAVKKPTLLSNEPELGFAPIRVTLHEPDESLSKQSRMLSMSAGGGKRITV